MIIFNLPAGTMLIGSAIIGYSVEETVGSLEGANLALVVALSSLFLFDLTYRSLRNIGEEWRLLKPTTGGQFMFLPMWSLAVFVMAQMLLFAQIV